MRRRFLKLAAMRHSTRTPVAARDERRQMPTLKKGNYERLRRTNSSAAVEEMNCLSSMRIAAAAHYGLSCQSDEVDCAPVAPGALSNVAVEVSALEN